MRRRAGDALIYALCRPERVMAAIGGTTALLGAVALALNRAERRRARPDS